MSKFKVGDKVWLHDFRDVTYTVVFGPYAVKQFIGDYYLVVDENGDHREFSENHMKTALDPQVEMVAEVIYNGLLFSTKWDGLTYEPTISRYRKLAEKVVDAIENYNSWD